MFQANFPWWIPSVTQITIFRRCNLTAIIAFKYASDSNWSGVISAHSQEGISSLIWGRIRGVGGDAWSLGILSIYAKELFPGILYTFFGIRPEPQDKFQKKSALASAETIAVVLRGVVDAAVCAPTDSWSRGFAMTELNTLTDDGQDCVASNITVLVCNLSRVCIVGNARWICGATRGRKMFYLSSPLLFCSRSRWWYPLRGFLTFV